MANDDTDLSDNESKDVITTDTTIRPLCISVDTNSITPLSSNTSVASLTPPAEAKPIDSDHMNDHRPKLRINVGLAADPALQPEAKHIHRIRANASESFEIESNCDDSENIAISPTIVVPDDDPPPEKIRRRDDAPPFQPNLLNKFVNAHVNATVNNINSAELLPRTPAFMCPPCGIKFSSISTLEAHQKYYCTHK